MQLGSVQFQEFQKFKGYPRSFSDIFPQINGISLDGIKYMYC